MAKSNDKKNITKNLTIALPGVLLIAILAGALTYGGQKAVAEATKPKAVVVKTETVATSDDTNGSGAASSDESWKGATDSSSTSAAKSDSAASSTPASTPAAAPSTPTATTNSFVYLRPGASTGGSPLKDLQAGTVVQYETKSTDLWQKVTVDGVTGYVYKKWLTY